MDLRIPFTIVILAIASSASGQQQRSSPKCPVLECALGFYKQSRTFGAHGHCLKAKEVATKCLEEASSCDCKDYQLHRTKYLVHGIQCGCKDVQARRCLSLTNRLVWEMFSGREFNYNRTKLLVSLLEECIQQVNKFNISKEGCETIFPESDHYLLKLANSSINGCYIIPQLFRSSVCQLDDLRWCSPLSRNITDYLECAKGILETGPESCRRLSIDEVTTQELIMRERNYYCHLEQKVETSRASCAPERLVKVGDRRKPVKAL